MTFLKIGEQKLLFNYLEQNAGWVCLTLSSDQKNAKNGADCTDIFGNLNL